MVITQVELSLAIHHLKPLSWKVAQLVMGQFVQANPLSPLVEQRVTVIPFTGSVAHHITENQVRQSGRLLGYDEVRLDAGVEAAVLVCQQLVTPFEEGGVVAHESPCTVGHQDVLRPHKGGTEAEQDEEENVEGFCHWML